MEKSIYRETVSLCTECGKESPSYYEEKPQGMFLNVLCKEHGLLTEKVENDAEFFKKCYELEYNREQNHFVFPITYRCNLNCKYCYTMSNCMSKLPKDRSMDEILQLIGLNNVNTTLIGGEPTVRKDLFEIIHKSKQLYPNLKLSLATNGQKLADVEYVKELKKAGLDFVYLSNNHTNYEESHLVYQNKMRALDNCFKTKTPVWLQRTVDNISQLDGFAELIDEYSKTIFNVRIRAVKPFGVYDEMNEVFLSDIIKYYKKENDYIIGDSPFNCFIKQGKKVFKLCSWVNDTRRIENIDSKYILSDNTMTTFHRGIRMDEILLKKRCGALQTVSK